MRGCCLVERTPKEVLKILWKWGGQGGQYRETQLAQSHEGEGAARSGVLGSRGRIAGENLNARLERGFSPEGESQSAHRPPTGDTRVHTLLIQFGKENGDPQAGSHVVSSTRENMQNLTVFLSKKLH